MSIECFTVPDRIGKMANPVSKNDNSAFGDGAVKYVTMAEDEKIDFFMSRIGVVAAGEVNEIVARLFGRSVASRLREWDDHEWAKPIDHRGWMAP